MYELSNLLRGLYSVRTAIIEERLQELKDLEEFKKKMNSNGKSS